MAVQGSPQTLFTNHMALSAPPPTIDMLRSVFQQMTRIWNLPSHVPAGLVAQMGVQSPRITNMCLQWRVSTTRGLEPDIDIHPALNFMRDVESQVACTGDSSPECRWLALVKHSVGGSFDPRDNKPVAISKTLSYLSTMNEKRITATIVLSPASVPRVSLSALFEKYLIELSNEKSAPRVHNSIRVNQRREELTISAGGGLDDLYAFSHSNELSNSIWIIMYVGPSKSLEYGKKVIEQFEKTLLAANYVINSSAIMTSDEEDKIERDTERSAEITRVRNMESMAQFALQIYCLK